MESVPAAPVATTAPLISAGPCASCGATLSADAQWCGQCYAVVGALVAGGMPVATPAPTAAVFGADTTSLMSPHRSAPAAGTLPRTVVKSRWRKTGTTFGPVGRLIATFAFVVPFIVFVTIAWFTKGLILAAPVIWGFVIMPWGLRDTWKAGQVSSR